jgi:hypothetical protein
MAIIIGCDSFLALRNVRNGNLGEHLRDEGVVALVDPLQYAGSQRVAPEGVTIERLLEFDGEQHPVLGPLLERAYMARKCYRDPGTMWEKLRFSSHRRNGTVRRAASEIRNALRLGWYWNAGRLGRAERWRNDVSRQLRSNQIVEAYRQRLRELDASAAVAFSLEGPREKALIEAANAIGIPTAVMIRSRDNLAAKIRHLPDAAAYLVWSDVTRCFMLHLYPEIDPARVHVVGSPQFDRHLDPSYRLAREDFFRRMELSPDRPLVVYTMCTPGLYDHEGRIVQDLADAAHAGRLAGGAQLLVRGHPRMFGSDLRLLLREYPEARSYPRPTDKPYRSSEHEGAVVQLILDDEPVHLATLAYQDVQVNICGTMTVDSAALDKPTVNVAYDPVRVLPGLSCRRFYQRSDIKQLMSYGCSRVARSAEECIRLVNAYLENPSLDSRARARARDEECGPLDERAGERIAEILRKLADKRSMAATPLVETSLTCY